MFDKILTLFRIKELRNKVLIIGAVLVCFRVLANIPVPGVNAEALRNFLSGNELLGLLNVFSGGSLQNLSIVMLGLGPYITATIIMQLLTMIFPKLKQLYYEEGAQGRAKFNRLARYITVPLAALNTYAFLKLLTSQGVMGELSLAQTLINVAVVTAGTMILVWFGEIITEQKMGNGTSLLIFAGIVSGLPMSIAQAYAAYTANTPITDYLIFIALALIVIGGVVMVNEGERKVPVSYAKRIRGNKVYGGVSTYLPLKVNQAGVIPIIFAISILLFPQFFGQILAAFWPGVGTVVNEWSQKLITNHIAYGTVYFFLVFIFTYFYTAVTFDPAEISKNLQRSGGFVPGIRPGESTGEFLKKIISRVTLFGGLFLGLIAVLPTITQLLFPKISSLTIGGTALLIVVAVAIDTAKQIDSQVSVREYDTLR